MILVTGATGLLGSHLLYQLVLSGEKPRATRRSQSDLEEVKKVFSYYDAERWEELFSKVKWVDVDLLYPESLDDIFHDVDRVYHAAAAISFDPRDRKKLINNNREITANVVNACLAGNIRLLHVSSTSALGDSNNGEAVTEKMMWTPDKMNTGYSISKFLSEMEVWRGIEEGLDAIIINPSIILGAGFWHKGSSSMFTNIRQGLKYYTPGRTGFVGVEDVVKSMIALMKSDVSRERFIINSENLSYREVFSMIAEALDRKPPSVEASPFLAGMAWRLDALRSFFGTSRIITRETIRAGNNVNHFSNEKLRSITGIEFENIRDVVRKICEKLKEEEKEITVK